jgi:hypothetical protein
MNTTYKSKLGTGLYSIAEAAMYARVPVRKMATWVFGSNRMEPVIRPEYGNEDRIVSYLDFIQMLAVRQIRIEKGVPLIKIRQAIDLAKTTFGMDHPFAMENVTYWNGSEIMIAPKGNEEELVQASGQQRGQMVFSFCWHFLDKLEYDRQGRCNLYKVYEYEGAVLTMNPRMRFGEPLLPSGHSAASVWDAIQIEGGIPQASRAYDIPENEVKAVHNFYIDFLGQTRATAA